MNLDLNIYAILITKYEKLNSLPSDWDKIEEYNKSLSENIYNKENDKSR